MVSVMIVTDHETHTKYVVYDNLVYLIQKDKTYLFRYMDPKNDKKTYHKVLSLQRQMMPKAKQMRKRQTRQARTRKTGQGDKGKVKKKQTKKR